MSVFEMILSAVCVVGVVSAWHVAVRRPEFGAWLEAWTTRISRETERANMEAYANGYQDGQEYERLRPKPIDAS